MMRVSGLATGMDTESIIKDMMQAHRIPLDKITQRKQYLEWQLDDYRGINRNLKSMSDNVFDTLLQEGTYLAKNVNVSNPNAVDIRGINAASAFSGTISISQLATQATLQSKKTDGTDGEQNRVLPKGADLTQKLDQLGITGTQTIKIEAPNAQGVMESKEVTIDTSQHTIKSALDKISKESGVTAFYDEFTGQIALTAKNSGEGAISVDGSFAGSLKLDSADSTSGQNAKFNFNGLETERSSNTFEINGFEVTLKEVTNGNPVTFSSSTDTDTILESVVKFVDDYNKMIEELNAKIREPKHRDFPPLSDEQKAEMKEKEIELWEEKAMSGTLRNDPTIQSLLQKMRSILNGEVTGSDGNKIRLSDIGITTSNNFRDNGKLVIDEKKLREVISDDPNKIYELLGKSGSTEEDTGLIERFRTAITDSRKAITAQAGSAGDVNDTFALGRTMKDMNSQITRFQDRMKMIEDRYWKQFTAMEMAIQRANAQSENLMSTFGGM